MTRRDVEVTVGILLLISVIVTGSLGYFQAQMGIHKFVPHRYAAYTTLILTTIHVFLNFGKLWHYFFGARKKQ